MEEEYVTKNLFYKYFILSVIILGLFIGSYFLLKLGFNDKAKVEINYSENNTIDYKVYLKKNDFFETKYLEKDKIYITSLINYIDIDYNYNLVYSDLVSGDYMYYIKATIEANKPNNDMGTYWSKEYKLTEEKKINLDKQDSFNISENIKIDYKKYNDILTEFKKQYGISVDGILKIDLIVVSDVRNERITKNIYNESYLKLNIPLTQLTVEASINTNTGNGEIKSVIEMVRIDSIVYLLYKIGGFILIVIGLIIFINLNRIIDSERMHNMYSITLKKILNTYDSIIVNTKRSPSLERFNIIKVLNFEELLDAHSEVRMPINFYENSRHNKSMFVLMSDKIAWVYVLQDKNFKK